MKSLTVRVVQVLTKSECLDVLRDLPERFVPCNNFLDKEGVTALRQAIDFRLHEKSEACDSMKNAINALIKRKVEWDDPK